MWQALSKGYTKIQEILNEAGADPENRIGTSEWLKERRERRNKK